jgi:phosphohistidine phosphatase SixA
MTTTVLPEQRRLIVMRHAKSAHDTDAATDHARPLNKRGQSDAPRVAEHLAKLGWRPDYVISSDALRTRQTLDGLLTGFGKEVAHSLQSSLYAGGYQELLGVARIIPASAETVLALGHNPGWEDVAEVLTDESVVLKTAACALMVLTQDCTWPEALRQCGDWRLENVIYPRDI